MPRFSCWFVGKFGEPQRTGGHPEDSGQAGPIYQSEWRDLNTLISSSRAGVDQQDVSPGWKEGCPRPLLSSRSTSQAT